MIMQFDVTMICDNKKVTDFLAEKFAEKGMSVFITSGCCRFGAQTFLTYKINITQYHNCKDFEDFYDFDDYRNFLIKANKEFDELFREVVNDAKNDIPKESKSIPLEYSFHPSFYGALFI